MFKVAQSWTGQIPACGVRIPTPEKFMDAVESDLADQVRYAANDGQAAVNHPIGNQPLDLSICKK